MRTTPRLAFASLLMVALVAGLSRADSPPPPRPLPADGIVTQPGVYRLEKDLLVDRSPGIEVKADDVTIDLSGHVLRFTADPREGTFGIVAEGRNNLRITNGTVGGFWFNVRTRESSGLRIEGVTFDHIPYCGINAASAKNPVIRGNTFTNFRYDIPKIKRKAYVIGITIRTTNGLIADNVFDAQYTLEDPGAVDVETVFVLFGSRTSHGCIVTDNQMKADTPLDRSYGVWIASDSNATVVHNTIRNMRYGVTLASNAAGYVGYNHFASDPPRAGSTGFESIGVSATGARAVLVAGNHFDGQDAELNLPDDHSPDWDNADATLAFAPGGGRSSEGQVKHDSVRVHGTFNHGGSIVIDTSGDPAGATETRRLIGWDRQAGQAADTRVRFTEGQAREYEFRPDGFYLLPDR